MAPYGLNPDLSDGEREQLERENFAVLMMNQALLGRIPPDVLGVARRLRPDCLQVCFAVRLITEEINEEIDDILGELDAFYADVSDAPRSFEMDIVTGPLDLGSWLAGDEPWRLVYAAPRSAA